MAAPHLQATDGYQVLWPLVGVLVLVSVPLIVPLVVAERRAAGDGGAVPAQLPIDPPL
jgi:hypothetical protein